MILYIGECKYILKAGFCCNWSVRCVVCVCCNFVLDRVRSGFVDVVVVLRFMVECVSTWLVGYVCEVGKYVDYILLSVLV